MGLPLPKMSLADYLAWEETQAERHEFVAGEVFAMTGGRRVNGRITANLTIALGRRLEGSPCQVFVEAMKVQVADDTVLYPDVFVSCDRADLTAEAVFRSPVLVIEVLSPSTQAYDRSLKFAQYRRLASLQEYVLIDPDTRRIEVFRKGADGLFDLHDMSEAEAVELASVDARVPMAEIYAGVSVE